MAGRLLLCCCWRGPARSLSAEIWQDASSVDTDKFDPVHAAAKLDDYLKSFDVHPVTRCARLADADVMPSNAWS
jgi:hypothetical protein